MKKATIANATVTNAINETVSTGNAVSTAKKEEKAMTENIATATAINESATSETVTAKTAKAPKTAKKRAAGEKKAESIETMAKASQIKQESAHIANSATESAKMAVSDKPDTANPETLKAIAELLGIASDDTKAIVQAVRKAAGEKERARRVSDCETFTSRKKLIAKYPEMDTNDNYSPLFKNGFTYSVFPGENDPEKPDFIAVTYYYSKTNSYEYRAFRLDKDMQAIRESVIAAGSIQELKAKVRDARASVNGKAAKRA